VSHHQTGRLPPLRLTPLIAGGPLRWWTYADMHQLICARGHRFTPESHDSPPFDITESGFVRCTAVDAHSQLPCDRWVFLFAIRGGGCVVADVSIEEKKAMKGLATPAAMIDYLGIFKR
jgi:hypothetical protein